MCGIVGYVGQDLDAKNIVLQGLKKLEYRGYDSAGISLFNFRNKEFEIYKDFGRVQKIVDLTLDTKKSPIGIGHTRWATHGKVTKDNAHPHYSKSGRFILVHNGVIENYEEVKNIYLKGHSFYSETDTEVIAKLIEEFAKTNVVEIAIVEALKVIKGSYALLVLDNENPEAIYVAKNKSPLLVGKGVDGMTIASDLVALSGFAEKYFSLPDHSFVIVKKNSAQLFDFNHRAINYIEQPIELDETEASKGDFQHFMLKEIYEQPSVIRRIIQNYYNNDVLLIDDKIISDLKAADRIYILAAGTSMHAGHIAKVLFEELANIATEVHIASEFAYNMPKLTKKPFFILISQSGETADLRACLVKVKAMNYPVLTITNVKTSTLAREADYFLEIFAGMEIAVASTKAYLAQIAVSAILANAISPKLDLKSELNQVAIVIEHFLDNQQIATLAHQIITKHNCFYIGRGIDYYTALEAALKLKEISYIQTEGFAAGELKHGTIALIEEKTPVIAIISSQTIAANTRSNLKETMARGAETIIIALRNVANEDDDIVLDNVNPLLAAMVTVVPTQLIAYYAALDRGLDIDKPRNLAKSVTVE